MTVYINPEERLVALLPDTATLRGAAQACREGRVAGAAIRLERGSAAEQEVGRILADLHHPARMCLAQALAERGRA